MTPHETDAARELHNMLSDACSVMENLDIRAPDKKVVSDRIGRLAGAPQE